MSVLQSLFQPKKVLFAATSLLLLSASSTAVSAGVEEGKALAFDRAKGNCLACHYIDGGDSPGDIAPPLMAIKDRFSKQQLRAQIWDPQVSNPETAMIPFGKHKVLTEQEIDAVVEFLWTL